MDKTDPSGPTPSSGTVPARDERDPSVGLVLGGRYRILRRIAAGGMGAVYEGEQIAIQKRVAIKMLHAHLATDPEIVARFRREALATTKIGHPNIVEVLDLGEAEDGSLFMVLEMLKGQDLAALLREHGPLPIGRVASILVQACSAISAAHDKGIVHRDLKPENIFLIERDGQRDFVKVLDFGISKIKDAALDSGDAHTRTGTALGTPYYMAPEQAQGRKDVDHRADIYALGVILFRLLTGHHPFDDTSYPMLVLKICTEPPPRIGQWRKDAPPALVALVDRMLAKSPDDRPASVEEIRAELERYRDVERAPSLTGAPAPSPSAPTVLSGRNGQATRPAARIEEDEEELRETAKTVVNKPSSTIQYLAIAGLAAITVAIVGAAVVGLGSEPPDEPEAEVVALPAPREPVVRALAPAGGSGGGGWTWINPTPRAVPTWYAVHVGGPEMVALVGQDGAAARYMNESLVRWRSGTTATLRAIAWISADDALAAGERGTLVRLTPERPVPIDTSGIEGLDGVTLRAIHVRSGTEAIVAGDRGTLLRLSGAQLRAIPTGTQDALLALHERGNVLWVAGESGTLLRIENDEITTESVGLSVALRAIGGCPRGDLYAAGDQGTVLRRSEGRWNNLRTSVERGETLLSITCDRGRAVITGNRGTVLLVSGTRSVRLPSGFDQAWHGVSGARDEQTWLVGAGGRMAIVETDHVRTLSAGPTVPLRDIGAIGGALVAVGEWGRIIRENERGMAEAASPTQAGLAALAALDETRLVAVGDSGAVVEIRFDGASLISSPTEQSLRDVISGGDGRLLIAGTRGTLLRGTLASLTESRVPETGDLWAIDGTVDDAITVGEAEDAQSAAVVHVTSSGAVRWRCGERALLRGVAVTPAGRFAVGVSRGEPQGVIVRIEEGGCVREHLGGPPLSGVGRGPDGRVVAVGDSGAAWARGEDGTWTDIELDLGGAHARALRRVDRHVYIVGSGGVIVRHVIADGT